MALKLNKDSFEAREVSLTSLVALCADCRELCLRQTERVMENRSRAPRGWDNEYKLVAEERRKEDYHLCEHSCIRVAVACPALDALERFEALGYRKAAQIGVQDGLPSVQQVSRCEQAAAGLSRVLFTLAHKPSKVMFEKANPKTGQQFEEEAGESAVAQKPLASSRSIDEAILNRWSPSARGQKEMEGLGFIRSKTEASNHKRDTDVESPGEAKGTVPKW
ncbi:hypothetical protein ERJ75_000740200 [Trypanosoma vivax]|uniref:Putative ribosomal P protein AGP2beta-1 n=1 Tax=Trypanosoma vivax (strain Y486) TaxID=1055687 RepID=G0TXG4_TRYVY|nr:putative ribosomal P protein AGP2beta-1 [Trypanosoma vivax]KAH8614012.1 hypothetical protein ERJ75_000740200 [Trypanosoma vivax]CCC48654.1 putative ribosomal P protein AGP2beta-1 [Trypanosoma vivax Y486]